MSNSNTTNVQKPEELNLDMKVTVRSIADWPTGFRMITEIGDAQFMNEMSLKIKRAEIIAQVNNSNNLFCGIDGKGSHATLIIEDEPTRREVGFDSDDGKVKQNAFSDSVVTKLFAIKDENAFKNAFHEAIKTRAERKAIIKAIKRLKLNDYNKIRYIEDETGERL